MIKKFLILLTLTVLTSCSAPGTALLGPVFTGATTKSAAQATLSFSTNQIIQNIKEASESGKKETIKIVRKLDNFVQDTNSKGFYKTVTNLYLEDQQKKKEVFLFHR